jgi:tetratricopeptide (TPR) repeat protein
MRNLALSLLLLIVTNACATVCRAEDAPEQPTAAANGDRATKGKKPKAAKTAGAASAPAANADNLSPEQIIDMYTSKNPLAAPSSSVPSDSLPASVPIPPSADSNNSSASSSIPSSGSSAGSNDTAGSNDSGGSNFSGGSNDDQPVIGERSIPEKTLKAGELNNAAIDALNNKEFKKAIDLLNQALAADRDYTQGRSNLRVAYFNYGVEMYNTQKYAEAIPLLEIALDLSKQLGKDQAEIKELYDECKKAVKETAK